MNYQAGEKPNVEKFRTSRRAFLGPMIAGLGGLALVFLRGTVQPDEEELYFSVHRLSTRFYAPDGYLDICYSPGELPGCPEEAFLELYLVKGGRHQHIQHLDELTGQVRINSSEAALSFVRLYTSPRTYYMFHQERTPAPANLQINCALEVVSSISISADFVYGDLELRDGLHRVSEGEYGNGYNGIIRAPQWPKELQSATVHGTRGGYLIRRPLLVNQVSGDKSIPRLVAVEEWVGPLGEFKLERAILLDNHLVKQLSLEFPVYS